MPYASRTNFRAQNRHSQGEREQNQKAEDMLRSLGRVVQRAAAAHRSAGGCRALATHVLNVPAMGDSITEGTVASVEKAVGDAVAVDEIVAVIDTDKVSVDVRSDTAGVVQSLSVAVDDEVQVGAEMMTLDTDGAAAPVAAPAAAPAAAPEPAAAPGRRPSRRRSGHVPLIRFINEAVAAQEGGFCACARARRRGARRAAVPSGLAVERGPRAALRPDAPPEAETAAVESGGGARSTGDGCIGVCANTNTYTSASGVFPCSPAVLRLELLATRFTLLLPEDT